MHEDICKCGRILETLDPLRELVCLYDCYHSLTVYYSIQIVKVTTREKAMVRIEVTTIVPDVHDSDVRD